MEKRLFSFILIFFVLFNSFVFKYKDINAAALPVSEIVGYILSVTGAVDVLTGGGIGKISNTVRDSLAQTVSDLMGTGIYTDADGNYVFSNTATQAIYDVIQGTSNSGTRVVSNFQGLTPMAGLYYFGNPNMNNQVKNWCNNNRTLYSSYICTISFPRGNPGIYSSCCYYDISNVAYICISQFQNNGFYCIRFYNSSGNLMTVNYSGYSYISNYGYQSSSSKANSIHLQVNSNSGGSNPCEINANLYQFNIDNDKSNSGITNAQYQFLNFPFYGNNGGSLFWSNKSLLLANNESLGFNKYHYPSGVEFANNFTEIPTINETVITNNNWDSIYNNYVSNVSNNVSNFYDVETNQYNYEEMYKYIKTFNNNITNEVDSGNTDIEQNINYNNQWLSLIYDRIGDINIKLDNTSSGGGNEVWTQQDIADIKASLLRLEGSLTQEYDQLEAIYTYLAILNNSIQAINSSDDPINIYNDYSDYYDILVDLPVSDVDDIIDKGDTVKELVPTVAPFSYLNLAGNILDDLTAQPVEPSFTIPLTFSHAIGNQAINIDEDLVLDLSDFNDIRLLVNGFFIILFIFGLCWLSVFLIKIMLDLLSWG